MSRQKNSKRKAALKKETLRSLEARALNPAELDQVIGGYVCSPRPTGMCSRVDP
jgi:hypothetical protein